MNVAGVPSRAAPLLVALAALALILLLRVEPNAPTEVERLYDLYDSSGSFDYHFESTVLEIASRLASATRYQGLIRVNVPPRPGYLTIWTVNPPSGDGFTPLLRCNCVSFPAQELVVCDADLLDAAPKSPPLVIAEDDDVAPSILLTWLIGHEMGHVVLRHGGGTEGYFALGHEHHPKVGVLDREQFSFEREADEFVAAALKPQLSHSIQYFSVLMNLYYDLLGPQPSPDIPNAETVVEVPMTSSTHPPFIWRLRSFMRVLETTYSDIEFPWHIQEELRLVPKEDAPRVERRFFFDGYYIGDRPDDAEVSSLLADYRVVADAVLHQSAARSIALRSRNRSRALGALDEWAPDKLDYIEDEPVSAPLCDKDPRQNRLCLVNYLLREVASASRTPPVFLRRCVGQFHIAFGSLDGPEGALAPVAALLLADRFLSVEKPVDEDVQMLLWLLQVVSRADRSGYATYLHDLVVSDWAPRFSLPGRLALIEKFAGLARDRGWSSREHAYMLVLVRLVDDNPGVVDDGSKAALYWRLANASFRTGRPTDEVVAVLKEGESVLWDALSAAKSDTEKRGIRDLQIEFANSSVYFLTARGEYRASYQLGARLLSKLERTGMEDGLALGKLLRSTLAAAVALGESIPQDLFDRTSMSLLEDAKLLDGYSDEPSFAQHLSTGYLALASAAFLMGDAERASTLVRESVRLSPIEPEKRIEARLEDLSTIVGGRLVPILDMLKRVPFDPERYEVFRPAPRPVHLIEVGTRTSR